MDEDPDADRLTALTRRLHDLHPAHDHATIESIAHAIDRDGHGGSGLVPDPLYWDPRYRDQPELWDWLESDYQVYDSADPRRLWRIPTTPDTPTVRAPRPRFRLEKRLRVRPAPYVGRAFVYAWYVGVSLAGRCVASEVWREYQDRGQPTPA
ncbi:hypothetical protein GCM10022243_48550 [Saccharothrix violaceirubra]|uniref:Uncharacterized protein n=1 Tax=Saccharothrix violaceirubra TaxID=413306 RepID=A0A7W7SZF9_9PSEU|nr:hypothetical protein [Saccharothrix violaceirubra]MBB4963802.1 hypothetical protein [Saccharothrix violaceirubra]